MPNLPILLVNYTLSHLTLVTPTNLVPSLVSLQLVYRIEPVTLNEALGETQAHTSVIGPLSRGQVVPPTTSHTGDGGKGPGGHELNRCTNSITHR